MIKITECPRDAMQGIKYFIPTDAKIDWLNALLKVGYDILDFGSFVSPKAIPQMRDTADVLSQIDHSSSTKLLAIIPNLKGAIMASDYTSISFLGYPHSISNTFLQRNINSNVIQSRNALKDIHNQCIKNNKQAYVYLSMCFGNIYEEPWSIDLVLEEIRQLQSIGIKHIALADTSGVGDAETIGMVFKAVYQHFKDIHFSLHLHTSPFVWYDKVDAAYKNGCTHFESVMNGMGGCPLAANQLIGNLNTSLLLEYLDTNKIKHSILGNEFKKASAIASQIFGETE